MPFTKAPDRGEIVMRRDVAGVLNALELAPGNRAAYALGYTEALKRVAVALGVDYVPPEPPHVVVIDWPVPALTSGKDGNHDRRR